MPLKGLVALGRLEMLGAEEHALFPVDLTGWHDGISPDGAIGCSFHVSGIQYRNGDPRHRVPWRPESDLQLVAQHHVRPRRGHLVINVKSAGQ